MTKAAWRQTVRARRAGLSATERGERDAARAEAIVTALSRGAAGGRPGPRFPPPAELSPGPGRPAERDADRRPGPGFTVAAYAAVAPEPDLGPLFDRLAGWGVRWLLPALARRPGLPAGRQDWAWWDGRAPLVAGWREIPEPPTPPLGPTGLAAAQLILLPGLAGSLSGGRLGGGGGWYDRALAAARPGTPRWLALNADEVVATLPLDPWDEPVDALVTETGFIPCV